MAKLPLIQAIKREDFKDLSKDLESFLDRLLRPLNLFIGSVYDALNGNLGFADNITAMKKDFTILAGAAPANNTFTFTHSLKKPPEGLFLLQVIQIADNYTPITSAVFLSWRRGIQQVIIDSITGLTAGETYNFTVLVI